MTQTLTINPYNLASYTSNSDTLPMFYPLVSDHVLTGQDAIGWALQGSLVTNIYPDAIRTIKNLYTKGKDTQYRGIECKLSTDGRYIADISQKEAIDGLFATTGTADFYILDKENNSFYLPKTNWFFKPCMDASLLNQYNEAGLPNIAQEFFAPGYINVEGGIINIVPDGPRMTGGNSTMREGSNWSIDFSRGNPIYGNSDTIEPQSSNKIIYYKVGNTISNQSSIDIGNILSELSLKLNPDLSNCIKPYILEMSSLDILPSFYILFSNGLLIQGGKIPAQSTQKVEIPLLKEYRDDNYWATSVFNGNPNYNSPYVGMYHGVSEQTSKSMTVYITTSDCTLSRTWITIGKAKQEEN